MLRSLCDKLLSFSWGSLRSVFVVNIMTVGKLRLRGVCLRARRFSVGFPEHRAVFIADGQTTCRDSPTAALPAAFAPLSSCSDGAACACCLSEEKHKNGHRLFKIYVFINTYISFLIPKA